MIFLLSILLCYCILWGIKKNLKNELKLGFHYTCFLPTHFSVSTLRKKITLANATRPLIALWCMMISHKGAYTYICDHRVMVLN